MTIDNKLHPAMSFKVQGVPRNDSPGDDGGGYPPLSVNSLIHKTMSLTISIKIILGSFLYVRKIMSNLIFSLRNRMVNFISVTSYFFDVVFNMGPYSMSMLSCIGSNPGSLIRIVTFNVCLE